MFDSKNAHVHKFSLIWNGNLFINNKKNDTMLMLINFAGTLTFSVFWSVVWFVDSNDGMAL